MSGRVMRHHVEPGSGPSGPVAHATLTPRVYAPHPAGLKSRRYVSGLLLLLLATVSANAQQPGRFLGREEIRVLGLGMRVEPERQTVPKDIATIVSTFLQMPASQSGDVSPFEPGTVVKGVLRGPSLTAPLELAAAPNTPFAIPPLSVPGIHTLDEIRLEVNGQVLMRGVPESAVIEVIDKLLVTEVTTRPLTAEEIREKGIVFDRSNFQAYNFTAAFAVQDQPIRIAFPVVLPTIKTSAVAEDAVVLQPRLLLPQPSKIDTIIPDTLVVQRMVPNMSITGFILELKENLNRELVVPPIPGVVVIPGQIGFLNQYFSSLLMVSNAAPSSSNLVVDNLRGEILLPAGRSGVVGAADAPLRMAVTTSGPSPLVQALRQVGADGALGTADDQPSIAPGETATGEYLIEGRREGTHTIEFNISATLHGLPGGPVEVTGRAAGAVVVRNPTFTLTFTHPDAVQPGEPYTLDVTVTNTSPSPANFVTVTLSPQQVAGATIVGDPARTIETIAPDDAATVSFSLIAQVSGRVYAATLDSDDNVSGRFALKAGVGELGVPVSPESLVLPAEANSLPASLRAASLGLLGKAWSVATAPVAALPAGVSRFSKKIVYDRAIEVAEAGFRRTLHEPLEATATHLLFDVIGNNFARLDARTPSLGERQFAERDYQNFDALRRKSVRGDVFARAIGAVLAPELTALGGAVFHRQFAERVSWRSASLSVFASADNGGPLPVRLVLVDAAGRETGVLDSTGRIVKGIPFSDVVELTSGDAINGSLSVIASLPEGPYRIAIAPVPGLPEAPFTLSVVYPDNAGRLHQAVFTAITAAQLPALEFADSDRWRVSFESRGGGGPPPSVSPTSVAAIVEPGPALMGVVQQRNADLVRVCGVMVPVGRIIAVLFNKELAPDAVQDKAAPGAITRYGVDRNQVIGVAQQPGRRIVFLALRDPVGPYVSRSLAVEGIEDGRGNILTSQSLPIETTVDTGAVLTGRVLQADGSPVGAAEVRLIFSQPPSCKGGPIVVSMQPSAEDGSFSWDYVARLHHPAVNRLQAFVEATGDQHKVDFVVQRDGQRLNVNLVLVGRGTYSGRLIDEEGEPLEGGSIRLTSLTDMSTFGATSNAEGRFAIGRVPVGNLLVEAVHQVKNARIVSSDYLPLAGGTLKRDLVLLSEDVIEVTARFGALSGHVLLANGSTPVAGVPVVAYYQHGSQELVHCPPPAVVECPVATTTTDASGRFVFPRILAGRHRVESFNHATLQEGEARITLPADGTVDFNLLLASGLGTVRGTVVDAAGDPVAGARVGGGLSLTTTNAAGEFVLTDVPIGQAHLVAVSDELATKGTATVDLVQAGQEVTVVIVLEAVASVAGRVFESDGLTPVAGVTAYLFRKGTSGIGVVGSAVTDAAGRYTIANIPVGGDYTLSAFRPDFSDGNLIPAPLRFNGQVFRGDIVFRGRGGIRGTVTNADGTTPLRAAVGVSGDRVVIAGGLVGVAFEHVKNFAIAETDLATGSFAFSGVFVGPFTIQAAGPFSPDPITAEGAIPAHNRTVEIDLRLTATSNLTGTVVQPDGLTPVGANVVVRYKSEAFRTICTEEGPANNRRRTCIDVPQGIQEVNVVTDASGRFTMPLVNAGRFTLTAEDPASGLTGQTRGQVGPGQDGDFPIRLLRSATLTVRVFRSDTTTPIPGARVEIQQITHPKRSVQRTADGNGVAVLAGADAFPEGELVIRATDLTNGFAGRATGKITKDDSAITVNVYLFDASGSVMGTVFRPDGLTPVPNAEVVVSNFRGPLGYAQTDEYGDYRVDVVPVGAFTIDVFEAATARLGFASSRVDLDRQEVRVDITQAAVGEVTGNVLTAGTLAPLKLWTVQLIQQAPSGRFLPVLWTTTGVDGGFAFPGTTEGAFQLVARRDHLFAQGSGRIDDEGDTVDIPLIVHIPTPEFGRLEGVVTNPDGSRASNAQVRVCTGACDSPSNAYQEFTLVAGVDGSFVVERIRVGRLDIVAKAQTSANAGRSAAQLAFDGDVTHTTVVLVGVSQVSGTVRLPDGSPAGGVRVDLIGYPTSGCIGLCTAFSDSGTGRFTFINVPAHTVTLFATHPLNGLRGIASGPITLGSNELDVVLQPSATLSGRVLTSAGAAASGITVELQSGLFSGSGRAFVSTDGSGGFTFTGLSPGSYTLILEDPVGPGVARRIIQLTGDLALGDLTLDEAGPSVSAVTPAASSTGVPLGQQIRIVFSEPLNSATVTAASVVLAGPDGAISSTLSLSENDTIVTLVPIAPLQERTPYTVQVGGVRDRVGKPIAPAFSASFTTVDITAPHTLSLSPPAGATGVGLNTTIRWSLSEPIDAARFAGPAIVLRKGGVAVEGRLDVILGNTVVVFTPARPLELGTTYEISTGNATDFSGNVHAPPAPASFTTTDLTPPRVLSLTAAASVIEGTSASVIADVGQADVAVVDFYINDSPVFAARTRPFTLTFEASPLVGAPGERIRISALATDTSGLRGTLPAETFITIVADQAPAAILTAPADGAVVKNGERVAVTVRGTDDVGVARIAYRALTGQPQDAESRAVTPAVLDRSETFGFNVPAALPPGTPIEISATVVDTKGRHTPATVVRLTVADATPPSVTIAGTSSGTRVRPGTNAVVAVAAEDLGGIASIRFRASGVVTIDETREVTLSQPSVAASFSFAVPPTSRPTDTITLNATAFDRAGNSADAPPVLLAIEDLDAPRVTIRTASGSGTGVIGSALAIVVTAEDEIGVARVDLRGSGAFTVATGKSISPPLGSATESFSIAIPASAPSGSMLMLDATARDVFGNVSAPVTLAVTLESLEDVSLPPSAILTAGEHTTIAVELSNPAPAGGTTVVLASTVPGIATVTETLAFAAGETVRQATLTAIAGGVASVTASIAGVPRAAMTVTVQGPVVSGIVYDPGFNPVAGAHVSVSGENVVANGTTDAEGRYQIIGPFARFNRDVTVRAVDPVSGLIGVVNATVNVPNGFARVNVVLLPAGSLAGTVTRADGTTPAGAGVRVELFDAGGALLQTRFTGDDSRFAFELVSLGSYRIDATNQVTGDRARTQAVLDASGQQLNLQIRFLGRGAVTGTVRTGGHPVPGAQMRLFASSLFGAAPIVEANAGPDGTFRFDDVFVGTVTIQGIDLVTRFAGIATGALEHDGQVLVRDISFDAYGEVSGTVFRSDGTTTVPNADVRISTTRGELFTFSGSDGRFSFAVVPVGTFDLFVRHQDTRGRGRATGTLAAAAQVTADVVMLPQGTVVATVVDERGAPAPGAAVTIEINYQWITESFTVNAGSDGLAIIDNVLAGPFTARARSGALTGLVTGTAVGGQVVPITITLEPTASFTGTVFLPDGQTPAQGTITATTRLDTLETLSRTVAIDSDGSYRIDGLPLRHYELKAVDQNGRPRVVVKTIALTAGGVERDLEFAAIGSVGGRVVNPDGSSAGNLPVTLQSQHQDFGGFRYATTNAGGFYEFADVYEGRLVVTAQNPAAGVIGEVTGILDTDGETSILDIQLIANAIRFPQTKRDASAYQWDVQQSGAIGFGTNSVFGPGFFANGGAFWLDIVAGGTATRFSGHELGTTELSSQQLVTRQNNVAGLNVTRKVYVPRSHFARYLEILSNPTAAPITVSVRIESLLSGFVPVQTVATSSGDATLSVADAVNPDRWLVAAAGADTDPFDTGVQPATGWTFDGPGARRRVSSATIAPRQLGNGLLLSGRVAYEWADVTIEPGGVVAFMHFGVQQTSRAAARASMERLVQLPPEAIEGLSPLEIAAIENFDVPPSGLSTLTALPRMGGTIRGKVLNADGMTPAGGGFRTLRVRSTIPVFARTYYLGPSFTDGTYQIADGGFDLVTNATVSIPLGSFVLEGAHPLTQVLGPAVNGSFPANQTTATVDYVYSNTAMVRGKIRRANGVVVTLFGSVVTARRTTPVFFTQSPAIAADGTYSLFGLPPGTFELNPSVPHPQGAALTGTGNVTVAAGDVQTVDLTLQTTGSLTGNVRNGAGAPVVGTTVTLRATTGFSQWAVSTSQTGSFTLADVPAGTFNLEVYDFRTNMTKRLPVTIVADQQTVQDVTLAPVGTISGRVLGPAGAPVAFVDVFLTHRTETSFSSRVTTDQQGLYSVANVPGGEVIVSTYEPTLRLFADASGRVSAEGETVTIDLRLQGVALPTSLTDANGFRFDIHGDGQILGPAEAFRQGYSLMLSFPNAGGEVSYTFPFRQSANTELEDRQLVIAPAFPPAGWPSALKATRKLFVPRDGYFIRYLEIFENTGAEPVSFSAQIHTGTTQRTVFRTSSNDQTFDAADRWVITDNGSGAQPVIGHLFAGPGAAFAPTVAGIAFGFNNVLAPYYRWTGLTLQPGERLVLMHFGLQQFDREGAMAAVERLGLLPPEALAGLTAAEIAGIRTFAVPADGSSAVPPLSGAHETVTASGRVFAHDATTPVTGAQVTFGSATRIFGPPVVAASDATGGFSLTRSVVDRFRLEARHPLTGVVGAVEEAVTANQTTLTRNIVFTGTGGVRGVARTGAGAPVAGGVVNVTDGVQTTVTLAAQLDGSYVISGLPPAIYTVTVTAGGRSAIVPGVQVAAGAFATADVTMPAVATVRVRAELADGSPVPSATIYIKQVPNDFLVFAGFTDAAGTLLVANVPQGPFTVNAYRTGILGTVEGVVGPGDEGRVLDAVVRPARSGSISGRVVAGDAQTGVPNVAVEVYDVASGEFVNYGFTDANGDYSIASVNHGTQGMRVVARGPNDAEEEATGAFTAANETLTFDFILPLAIVQGVVRAADGGVPDSGFQLEAAQAGPLGRVLTSVPEIDGNQFRGFLAPGAYTLLATDLGSYGWISRSGQIAGVASTITVDLTLPPTGTVTGTIRDSSGASIAGTQVGLTGVNMRRGYAAYVSTDAQGVYRVERVPLGILSVQACDASMSVCGSQSASLSGAGSVATVDITTPEAGTVEGTARNRDGSPLSRFSPIRVLGGNGGPVYEGAYVFPDALGRYSAPVPAGDVSASFATFEAALSLGTLLGAGPLTLDLLGGADLAIPSYSATPAPGLDEFRYDAQCDGSLAGGEDLSPYAQSYTLRVNGSQVRCLQAARHELNGRQAVYGPYPLADLQVTRRVYLPSEGGFVRYLETFSNPGGQPITIVVQVESTWSVVANLFTTPVETAQTFAVTVDGSAGASGRSAVAHVFAGPGAAVPPGVEFQPLLGETAVRYQITVPAGGFVSLLHFTAQRAGDNPSAARGQGEALATLTDPGALAGLSAAEKASIVNFVVP